MKKLTQQEYEYFGQHLTLFYDIVFKEVAASHKDFVEDLLKLFLNDKELTLIEYNIQKNFQILNQKGVILDCYCKLGDGKLVNIELEKNDNNDKCDHQKRVRYYSSMINVKNLSPGDNYDTLPDLYMIYITYKDIFKRGKAIYHIERYLTETKEYVFNGYHEIYINAEIDDNSEISKMMKNFTRSEYLNERFSNSKQKKEGVYMPPEMREVNEALERLKKESYEDGKITILIDLLNQNIISEDVVLKRLNISKEKLASLIKEQS